MALDFSKNTSNYADFGINKFAALLSGAVGISFSCSIKVDTLSGGGDDIFYIWTDDSGILFRVFMNVNAPEADCRSNTTEFRETQVGQNINDGNWHFFAAGFDLANDRAGVFTDGVGSEGATSFAETSFVPGTPTTNPDGLGARVSSGGPTSTNRQFDGQLGHVALWNVKLTRGQLQSVGTGMNPLVVRPNNLLLYLPLVNSLLDGRDSGDSGLSITGSVPFIEGNPSFRSPQSPVIA